MKKLFTLDVKKTHPLLAKDNLSDDNQIIPALIKEYGIEFENIVKQDKYEIIVNHPDFDYNLKIHIAFIESSESKDLCFFLNHISKKSHYNFTITSLESVFNLDEGLHPLGVGFDDLDMDEDEVDIMRAFLAVINSSELFEDSSMVQLTNPQTKEKIEISIEPVGAADSYGLRVEKLEKSEAV